MQDVGTRGETFNGENDRCREIQGWTTACSSMSERDGEDQGKDGPQPTCSCRFARHSYLVTSGAKFYPPDAV